MTSGQDPGSFPGSRPPTPAPPPLQPRSELSPTRLHPRPGKGQSPPLAAPAQASAGQGDPGGRRWTWYLLDPCGQNAAGVLQARQGDVHAEDLVGSLEPTLSKSEATPRGHLGHAAAC